jgi:hypothetical protein
MKNNFKKSDLKTGMFAEMSTGELVLIISNSLIGIETKDSGFGGRSLDNYNKYMVDKEDIGDYIIRVFKEPYSLAGSNMFFKCLNPRYITDKLELLWERKPEPTYTIDDIEYSESTLRNIIKKAHS